MWPPPFNLWQRLMLHCLPKRITGEDRVSKICSRTIVSFISPAIVLSFAALQTPTCQLAQQLFFSRCLGRCLHRVRWPLPSDCLATSTLRHWMIIFSCLAFANCRLFWQATYIPTWGWQRATTSSELHALGGCSRGSSGQRAPADFSRRKSPAVKRNSTAGELGA